MTLTSTFHPIMFLSVLDILKGVFCGPTFVRFDRGKFLDGHVCNSVIRETTFTSYTRCLNLCSSQASCHGVFFEPDEMRCAACSDRYFRYNSSTVSMFFQRHAVSAYLLVTQPLTWYNAKQNCENLGGHLAIITSEEENDYIVQYVNTSGISQIYIGGKGIGGRAETFEWVDGSKLSNGYTNWRGGQPYPLLTVERYIYMIRSWDFQWNDEGDGARHSICEFE